LVQARRLLIQLFVYLGRKLINGPLYPGGTLTMPPQPAYRQAGAKPTVGGNFRQTVMKGRSSVYKALWTHTREAQYHKNCDELLLGTNSELIIKGNEVYLKSQNQKILLCEIQKPGSMWYEIWLNLKSVE